MFLLIFILLFQTNNIDVHAYEKPTYYARIMFEQVYFYKTPTENNSYENVYFELPKSYFVELTDICGDFYKATYLNITGYVKKDSVQAVDKTPSNPFLDNISFRVYSNLSESIWLSPNHSSIKITDIPHLTKNIQYIGKIVGDTLIDGRTNVWFYCKYSSDEDYYGYVFSDFCDELSTIVENTETLDYVSNPTFAPPIEPTNTIPQNNKIVGLIVGILSIPALIFVLMMIKGTKILTQEKTKRKEIIDY